MFGPQLLLEDLGRNIAFVLGVMFGGGLLRALTRERDVRLRAALSGLLFGLSAVLSMSAPVRLAPGIIMDMRNVLVALCFVFEGPLAGLVAAVMATAYRFRLAGTGLLPGVLLIGSAAAIGALAMRRLRGAVPASRDLLAVGVAISVAALLCTLTLAFEMGVAHVVEFEQRVLPTVMLGYPLGTLLVGTLLSYESTRREAERALKRERDLLSRVASTSPAGIVVLDRTGNIIMANAQAERVLGASSVDLLRRRHDSREWGITDYDGRPVPYDALPFAQAQRTGAAVLGTRLAIEARGRRVLLSLNAAPMNDERGNFTGVVVTLDDVTERVRAELRLQESEQKFRTLFDRASDAIFVQAASDEGPQPFLEVNEVACRWLGRSREELAQLTLSDIDGAHSRQELTTLFHAARERAVTFEATLKEAHGEGRAVEVVAHTLSLADKQVVMALARDLSERRRLERQVLQSQKMEVVGRLAGGIAHDFNNILAIIMFSSEMLERSVDPVLNAKLSRDIVETAQRGASLTRQLLTFSRKQVVVPRTIVVRVALSNMVRLLRRLIPANIEMRTHFEDQDASVRIDVAQLEQVLLNLVINARDAMPSWGNIELSTRLSVVVAQRAGGVPPGEYVVLEVSDNGAGMDAEVRAHLFEPFFTTKRDQGTGLGLATCASIVSQAGGSIDVTSELGTGATFRVYLPRVPSVPVEAGQIETRPEVGRERILLVEDEPTLRAMIKTFLFECGYEVYDASCAERALAAMPTGVPPPELLVTDVMMPGMSGPELFEQLRSVIPRLKVVYMTGYAAEGLSDSLRARRGVGLVQKPFSTDVLAQAVRAALDDVEVNAEDAAAG